MDGLAVRVLCNEWNHWFSGARIDKIHQPTARDLVLTVRSQGKTSRLLLSAHRQFGRAHVLRTGRPDNPVEPPMFCMLLRRRMEGGRILSVTQPGWERVLSLHIESVNDIGDPAHYALVLEVMGKHSNLIFCSADSEGRPSQIVDAVVHVTPDMSRVRQILPGLPYLPPPPQDKLDVAEVAKDNLATALDEVQTEKDAMRVLMRRVHGVGPVTAREGLFRSRDGERTDNNSVAARLQELFDLALSEKEPPSVGLNSLGYATVAAPFLVTAVERYEAMASYDEAVERLYQNMAEELQSSAERRELERVVRTHLDRLRGKQVKLSAQLEASKDIDTPRIFGELLMAYSYQVEKGAEHAWLPNFYDDEKTVEIDLDPALTAIENATRYFRAASKRKRGLPILEQELTQTESDLTYLEGLLATLAQADKAHYGAIRSELEKQGFLERRKKRASKKKQKNARDDAGRPDEFWSQNEMRIRVGRNNLQNDKLTLRWSQPHDIWMHVQNVPGSHVVIETQGRDVPDDTLREAALLAAYFSKARDSSNVAVDYTSVQHVWKPNGARPGHVLYDHQKTLYATPDHAVVSEIMNRRPPSTAE